jgi:hypothetical protein
MLTNKIKRESLFTVHAMGIERRLHSIFLKTRTTNNIITKYTANFFACALIQLFATDTAISHDAFLFILSVVSLGIFLFVKKAKIK